MGLVEQLIWHEGLKLKPYTDTVGKLTIGVGRNLDDLGISKEEAILMLENDIRRCKEDLSREIDFYHDLNPIRKDVLTNMCFNMGIFRLKGFKNMLGFLKNGDYERASEEMLNSKWATQVGKRATELAEQMRSGT